MNHIIEHDILCDEEDISFSCSSTFFFASHIYDGGCCMWGKLYCIVFPILNLIHTLILSSYFFCRLHIYYIGTLGSLNVVYITEQNITVQAKCFIIMTCVRIGSRMLKWDYRLCFYEIHNFKRLWLVMESSYFHWLCHLLHLGFTFTSMRCVSSDDMNGKLFYNDGIWERVITFWNTQKPNKNVQSTRYFNKNRQLKLN